MTGAGVWPWLRDGPFETPARACIDQLLGARLDIGYHLLLAADVTGIELGCELSGFRRDLAGLRGAAFAGPFLQAAIQHLHVAIAERQEHPPRPRWMFLSFGYRNVKVLDGGQEMD